MMARANLPTVTTRFQQVIAAIDANAADFPHVQPEVQELRTLVPEIIEMNAAQAALFAQSQQATKDLSEKLDRGLVLFAQLRSAVKAKYSTRSEKLTEFHLRPLTRRRSPAALKVEKKKEETPPAPASTPTTPATNT
jgi:hypothetical protein